MVSFSVQPSQTQSIVGRGPNSPLAKKSQEWEKLPSHVVEVNQLPAKEKFLVLREIYKNYQSIFHHCQSEYYALLKTDFNDFFAQDRIPSEEKIELAWSKLIDYLRNPDNKNRRMYDIICQCCLKKTQPDKVSTIYSPMTYTGVALCCIVTLVILPVGALFVCYWAIDKWSRRNTLPQTKVYQTIARLKEAKQKHDIGYRKVLAKKIAQEIKKQYGEITRTTSEASKALISIDSSQPDLNDFLKGCQQNKWRDPNLFFDLLIKYLSEKRSNFDPNLKNNGKRLFLIIEKTVDDVTSTKKECVESFLSGDGSQNQNAPINRSFFRNPTFDRQLLGPILDYADLNPKQSFESNQNDTQWAMKPEQIPFPSNPNDNNPTARRGGFLILDLRHLQGAPVEYMRMP